MPSHLELSPWTPPRTGDIEALLVGKWWGAVSTSAAVGDRALQLPDVAHEVHNWALRGFAFFARHSTPLLLGSVEQETYVELGGAS